MKRFALLFLLLPFAVYGQSALPAAKPGKFHRIVHAIANHVALDIATEASSGFAAGGTFYCRSHNPNVGQQHTRHTKQSWIRWLRDRAATALLFLAVIGNHFLVSAYETRAVATELPISIGQSQSVGIACPVRGSVFVPVINTISVDKRIEALGIERKTLQSDYADIHAFLLSSRQRKESDRFFWGYTSWTTERFRRMTIILDEVRSIWNHVDLEGVPSFISNVDKHMFNFISITVTATKWSQQSRWFRKNYVWPMLCLKMPFALKITPDVDPEDAHAGYESKSFSGPLDLLCSTGRFPVLPKALLFLLAGFLTGGAGFASFFSCLSFRSSWRQIAVSLIVAVFGIFIFHIGLFYLLK